MIKFKNSDLQRVYDFLIGLSLKGKKSIHRMRIANAIESQAQKVSVEEVELLKQFCPQDDEGEFKRKKNGSLAITDRKAFNEEQNSLMNEYFVIDDVNLQSAISSLRKVVFDYNKELEGDQAIAHYCLVEALGEEDEE